MQLGAIFMLLALAGSATTGTDCPLELRLVESHYPLEISSGGKLKKWQVQPVLQNTGAEPFRFLWPGYDSLRGLRMPLVWWEVEGDWHEWPEVPPVKGCCGNMRAITERSFYTLNSGSTYNFKQSMPSFALEEPGEYRARLRFLYDPYAPWKGTPGDPHDARALAFARSLPHCDLSSDWITVILPEDREASTGNWDPPCSRGCGQAVPIETVWQEIGRGEIE